MEPQMILNRRIFLASASAAVLAGLDRSAFAQAPNELRVGYQKNGILVIARQQAALEKRFPGTAIKWVEFSAGPPLLEAMNAGAIDIGAVGDSPPIFAQAAGANSVYAAGQPITNGQGILVRGDSNIRSIAELKGKRVGFAKGSSAHNVTVAALEHAGLTYADITPVYLNPPEATSAFTRGSIDAWAIWDPYYAIGELRAGGRVLVHAHEIIKSNSFYIANRAFAARQPAFLRDVIDVLAEVGRWAETHRSDVGKSLAEVTGVDLAIQSHAADRASFAIGRVTPDIVATQQAVADRFHKLGLIPRAINVRDAVWAPPQS
jgi:sulfonate transport system substrate-binding protein